MVQIIFLNDSVFYQTILFVFIINFQLITLAFKYDHDYNIIFIGFCLYEV